MRGLSILLGLALCGCGTDYCWRSSVPETVRTVAVPTFRNESNVMELGAVATRQVLREFQREGTFKIRATGDAALEVQGVVRSAHAGISAYDRRAGSRISAFTLEDAFVCADAMVRELDGVRPVVARLRGKYANDRSRRRDLGIMVTLMDLFESGRDIFRFYIVRRDGIFASRTDGDNARALACVAEMKDIIARERGRSEEMIPLCEDDSRLGFHSEAQAHQFTADYLRWRIGELAKADAELQAIERDLKAGKACEKHLADQLLLPLNVLVGGERKWETDGLWEDVVWHPSWDIELQKETLHYKTNQEVIAEFGLHE